MKTLLIIGALLSLASCTDKQKELPTPTAVSTSDNRIGQGTISYTSSKKENTIITFVPESTTSAAYYFEFTEKRKDNTLRNIYYNTGRLVHGDTVHIKVPFFIPKTSRLRVKEYYQDYHDEPVLIGTFPVERVSVKTN